MPIAMSCAQCLKNLTVADKLAGKKIKCPGCQAVISVPGGDDLELGAPSAEISAPLPSPKAAAAPADDLELMTGGPESPGSKETKRCLGCDTEIPADFMFCTHCGFDFKTGRTRHGGKIGNYSSGWTPAKIIKAVVTGVFIIAGLYACYYFYINFTKEEAAPPGSVKDTKSAPANPDSTAKADDDTSKATPKPSGGLPKQALVIVTNNRFPKVRVYLDGQKTGDVTFGNSEQYTIETSKSMQLCFEVRELERGMTIANKVKNDLDKGIPILCAPGTGAAVTLDGPGAWAPKPQEVLSIPPTEFKPDAAGGTAITRELKYNGAILKGTSASEPLRLGYSVEGGTAKFTWLVQDCVVEKDGKVVYEPPDKSITNKPVTVVSKNGQLEIAN